MGKTFGKALKDGWGRSVVNGREILTPPSKEGEGENYKNKPTRNSMMNEETGEMEEVSDGEIEAMERRNDEEREERSAMSIAEAFRRKRK